MRKVYSLFLFTVFSYAINAQIEGTWKLADRAGALGVGPGQGDVSWWASDLQAVTDRACLFDDSLTFDASGNVTHYMDNSTWLEIWQGVFDPQCFFPLTPHAGGAFTYTYDAVNGTLTMNGVGAHLGLAKVINGPELINNNEAPASITYNVSFSNNNNTMTVDIEIETRGEDGQPNGGVGWWRFVYDRTDAPEITNPNVTFSVDMSQYSGMIANGVFLNGGFNGWCGECTPMTNIGNNIWETTLSLPAGGIEYKFTVDGWFDQDDFSTDTTAACVKVTYNVADTFVNRFYEVTQDASIPTVCFNSCDACSTNTVEDLNLNSIIRVNPNPSSDKIEVYTKSIPTKMQLVNSSGIKVLEINNLNSNKNTIDVSKLPSGIYLLNVNSKDGNTVEKIVVN